MPHCGASSLYDHFDHCFRANCRTEMANIEQAQQMIPFVTRKLSLVSMSASWFLVSMCLIWIVGSKLTLSSNQSRATLWVLETCLIVGLLPLIFILFTASLSSKTYNNIAVESQFSVLDGRLSMCVRITLVCFIGIGLCMFDFKIAEGFHRSTLMGPFSFVRYGMKYFNHLIPESESGNTVHA